MFLKPTLKKICLGVLLFLITPSLVAADLYVRSCGLAYLNGHAYRCALGTNGVTRFKKEGDLKTPAGKFPLRYLYYRPDKFPQGIRTKLVQKPLSSNCGWCDDMTSIYYNRAINLPFSVHYEPLWLNSDIYDLILI